MTKTVWFGLCCSLSISRILICISCFRFDVLTRIFEDHCSVEPMEVCFLCDHWWFCSEFEKNIYDDNDVHDDIGTWQLQQYSNSANNNEKCATPMFSRSDSLIGWLFALEHSRRTDDTRAHRGWNKGKQAVNQCQSGKLHPRFEEKLKICL